MTNAHTLVAETHVDADLLDEHDEEEYESIGDYHRIAALHYSQASKHHSLAADADDQGHEELSEDNLEEI